MQNLHQNSNANAPPVDPCCEKKLKLAEEAAPAGGNSGSNPSWPVPSPSIVPAATVRIRGGGSVETGGAGGGRWQRI